MGYSAIKKSRQVNRELDNKTESKRFYEEVYKHYGPIKKFVDGEIAKGTNTLTAIDKVLNNDNILRLYPELRKASVKRNIRGNLLRAYFAPEIKRRREQKSQKNQGEER